MPSTHTANSYALYVQKVLSNFMYVYNENWKRNLRDIHRVSRCKLIFAYLYHSRKYALTSDSLNTTTLIHLPCMEAFRLDVESSESVCTVERTRGRRSFYLEILRLHQFIGWIMDLTLFGPEMIFPAHQPKKNDKSLHVPLSIIKS